MFFPYVVGGTFRRQIVIKKVTENGDPRFEF